MKTSFYFVLWIIVYPVLGLLNSSFIDNNSFIFALAIVWGVSCILEYLMPQTLTYQRITQVAPILEYVYTGDLKSFRKRLVQDIAIEAVSIAYLFVTTVVIAFDLFKTGNNDWIGLAFFGFFTIKAIIRCVKLLKANSNLASNPTIEQCIQITNKAYGLDYASYQEAHVGISYKEMLEPRPKFYMLFQIFSTVVAIASLLLGLLLIAFGILIFLLICSIETDSVASMFFLYGSLAVYFGVKDIITARIPKKFR